MDPENASSRNQRAKRLEELSAACVAKLRSEIQPALQHAATVVFGPQGWTVEFDDAESQTLLFHYPSALGDAPSDAYIRRVVKIEGGARSDRWPVESGTVTPYVAEAFPTEVPSAATTIPVLSIERTFWEKATILHAEAHRPTDKETPLRLSRHYADVAVLAKHEAGIRALERDDLRARVVAHKQVFFATAWAHYETAVPGSFRFTPPKHQLDFLQRDYQAMREMFFHDPPSWSNIIGTLTQLEQRINVKQA
jgi:hypothetical protein